MTKTFCDRCGEEKKSGMRHIGHVGARDRTPNGQVFWDSKEVCNACFDDYKIFLKNLDVAGRYVHHVVAIV